MGGGGQGYRVLACRGHFIGNNSIRFSHSAFWHTFYNSIYDGRLLLQLLIQTSLLIISGNILWR